MNLSNEKLKFTFKNIQKLEIKNIITYYKPKDLFLKFKP